MRTCAVTRLPIYDMFMLTFRLLFAFASIMAMLFMPCELYAPARAMPDFTARRATQQSRIVQTRERTCAMSVSLCACAPRGADARVDVC